MKLPDDLLGRLSEFAIQSRRKGEACFCLNEDPASGAGLDKNVIERTFGLEMDRAQARIAKPKPLIEAAVRKKAARESGADRSLKAHPGSGGVATTCGKKVVFCR